MFDYVPDGLQGPVRRRPRRRPTAGTPTRSNNRRPPELLPRDEVARVDQLRGQGRPRLTPRRRLPRRRPRGSPRRGHPQEAARRCTTSSRSWPTSTSPREPMEVGPDLPLRDGRRRGRPRHRRSRSCPACSRPARSPAACTARTGSAATRCPTCWCSAGGPALGAADYIDELGAATRAKVSDGAVDAAAAEALAPFRERGRREPVHAAPGAAADDERPGRHHPRGRRDRGGAGRGSRSSRSAPRRSRVEGHRAVQPRLAPRARPAQHAARLRVRGHGPRWSARRAGAGTPATTSPAMGAEWRKVNLVCRLDRRRHGGHGRASSRCRRCAPTCSTCSTVDELTKYLTDDELAELPTEARHDELQGEVPGLARRRRAAASSRTSTVEVNEGEVVLDIIHRLQATQAPRPRGPVELQGRQVRLVQRRDQRPAAADVHDPDVARSPRTRRSRSRRCGRSR